MSQREREREGGGEREKKKKRRENTYKNLCIVFFFLHFHVLLAPHVVVQRPRAVRLEIWIYFQTLAVAEHVRRTHIRATWGRCVAERRFLLPRRRHVCVRFGCCGGSGRVERARRHWFLSRAIPAAVVYAVLLLVHRCEGQRCGVELRRVGRIGCGRGRGGGRRRSGGAASPESILRGYRRGRGGVEAHIAVSLWQAAWRAVELAEQAIEEALGVSRGLRWALLLLLLLLLRLRPGDARRVLLGHHVNVLSEK